MRPPLAWLLRGGGGQRPVGAPAAAVRRGPSSARRSGVSKRRVTVTRQTERLAPRPEGGREGGRSRAGQGMAWVRCSRQLSPRWRELLLEPDKRAASLQALPVSRGLDLGEFGYRGGRQRVTAWLDSSSPDRRLPGQNCVRASAVWRGCLWRAVLSGLQKWGRKLCVSRYC